ncbi:MAG: glutamine--tRNA ligase/YqeY domain fusion protein [Candidatus Scalindua sp.]|nr:glutamine--tRNA ligase/YqeY domain fusion protein [Candidatus Scalindua sp.]
MKSENNKQESDSGNGKGKGPSVDFIRTKVADDIKTGRWGGKVITRFPPEPNGYLHIGHGKAICLSFGIAAENSGGRCHLRFDDTNPVTEEARYADSIQEDIRWLGWDWGENLFYASDYFEKMYEYAVILVKKGRAYVCDLTFEQFSEYRGTLTTPGRESPFRSRSVEENLDLLGRMRNGEFEEGSRVLRAKIDMKSPNLNMRDPVMYRIIHAVHFRTGSKWCIYPTYDWAHGLEDSLEGVTHSICTLEFENHRPLYDWYLDQLEVHHPQQIEFARLELTYTIMSKRKLLQLVEEGHVKGWDDPRMPTICGMRRRGYTPESIRTFCRRIGVNKFNSTIDIALLEHCLREDLNSTSRRVMAVLCPLKVVIDNFPENEVEWMDAVNNPGDASAGMRRVPFSKVLYIEQDDFMEDPPRKFFRLSPGSEVRLRYAYFVTCTDVVKDEHGQIVELHCTYDPATRGGNAPDGRKVKSTLHWVSAARAKKAEVRLYEHLFTRERPEDVAEGSDFTSNLDLNSLKVLSGCMVEPSLGEAKPLERFQFERLGYFCVDPDTKDASLVFNRTVTLRDTWAKVQKSEKREKSIL